MTVSGILVSLSDDTHKHYKGNNLPGTDQGKDNKNDECKYKYATVYYL